MATCVAQKQRLITLARATGDGGRRKGEDTTARKLPANTSYVVCTIICCTLIINYSVHLVGLLHFYAGSRLNGC